MKFIEYITHCFFLISFLMFSTASFAGQKLDISIKNVIFDIGGVLISLNNEEWAARMTPLVGSVNGEKFRLILDQFETGRMDARRFRDAIRSMKSENLKLTDAEIDSAWNSQIGEADCTSLKMIKSIKDQGYNTYALSTSNPIHQRVVEDKFRRCFPEKSGDMMSSLFRKVYWTHQVGLLKPSLKAYSKVLANAGKKAKETLYVDDSPENVLGAQRAGLYSLLVTGPTFNVWVPRVIGANIVSEFSSSLKSK